jgi:hypothetical protein
MKVKRNTYTFEDASLPVRLVSLNHLHHDYLE